MTDKQLSVLLFWIMRQLNIVKGRLELKAYDEGEAAKELGLIYMTPLDSKPVRE
jgi:hypothetical protein